MMMSAVTSSYEVIQPLRDASVPPVTDGSRSEVSVKPVPRPRSKVKPKPDRTGVPGLASESPLNVQPADDSRPRPVRPPPPPLHKHLTSTAAADGGNCSAKSNTYTDVRPPAVTPERTQISPPPRPERPRLPSSYYDRLSSVKTKSEIHTDESQQSGYSSISYVQQTTLTSDEGSGCGNHAPQTRHPRPAVPPRLGQSTLPHPTAQYEATPTQSRPPLPAFKAPPPPSESIYSEIEYRPYLDILPEDEEDCLSHSRSTLRIGEHRQSGPSPHQQATPETEDVNVMLRWLKRVSKAEFMSLSLYGLSIEEEIRSFQERAMNLRKALRLYNLLMMKRNEPLRDSITEFTSIAQSLDKLQKKNKTMDIAGGTTGAVGGVTAVLGIALAPVTLGTSLIATVLGAGMVASAGGMSAHAAQKAKKKTVNRMTVERLVSSYKTNVVDIEYCLDFILSGMNELRRHDIARLQRAGAQTDALKTAHLSQFVMRNHTERRTSVTHTGGMSSERVLQVFVKELDQYFREKDDQKVRKSIRSRFSGRVRLLAENLQVELDHLNQMWEMFS